MPAAMASTLKDLGFETHLHQNLSRRDMNSALAKFTGLIEKNDEILFFFSGHGIAVRGENYLLPTDVPAVIPGQEGFITREAFAEDEIIRSIQDAGARVSILILDACRNNPFPTKRHPLSRAFCGVRAHSGPAPRHLCDVFSRRWPRSP